MNDFTTIIPAVEDIALLIATRTILPGGAESDTFSSATRPTDEQALSLAAQAAREVMSALGIEDVPDALIVDCTALVAIRTAQLVELSFFTNQDSPASVTLAASYTTGLATLADRLHYTEFRL
jgi:hypothetical protein